MPLARRIRVPNVTVTMTAASPAMKVTVPITTAFAINTRPRRGLASRVVRIRPRRYSAVMNITARTITRVSAMITPVRVNSIFPCSPSGPMSPVPVTVNVPPDSTAPPG